MLHARQRYPQNAQLIMSCTTTGFAFDSWKKVRSTNRVRTRTTDASKLKHALGKINERALLQKHTALTQQPRLHESPCVLNGRNKVKL
jgi:hypothetical protein